MKPNSTPEEYSTICPYLMVDDLKGELGFLKTVFAAKIKEEIPNQQGEIFHAEVMVDEVVIMLGASRLEWPARTNMNYVFVENVDQTFGQAITAGASGLMDPGDRDYGLREGGFTDPQGNQWWIASPLSDASNR